MRPVQTYRMSFPFEENNFFKNTILQFHLLVKEFYYIPIPHILCWHLEMLLFPNLGTKFLHAFQQEKPPGRQ